MIQNQWTYSGYYKGIGPLQKLSADMHLIHWELFYFYIWFSKLIFEVIATKLENQISLKHIPGVDLVYQLLIENIDDYTIYSLRYKYQHKLLKEPRQAMKSDQAHLYQKSLWYFPINTHFKGTPNVL